MTKSCKSCRWVIARILDSQGYTNNPFRTDHNKPNNHGLVILETLVCMPNGIEPDQIALGVCESWRSHIDTPDYFEDLQ